MAFPHSDRLRALQASTPASSTGLSLLTPRLHNLWLTQHSGAFVAACGLLKMVAHVLVICRWFWQLLSVYHVTHALSPRDGLHVCTPGLRCGRSWCTVTPGFASAGNVSLPLMSCLQLPETVYCTCTASTSLLCSSVSPSIFCLLFHWWWSVGVCLASRRAIGGPGGWGAGRATQV